MEESKWQKKLQRKYLLKPGKILLQTLRTGAFVICRMDMLNLTETYFWNKIPDYCCYVFWSFLVSYFLMLSSYMLAMMEFHIEDSSLGFASHNCMEPGFFAIFLYPACWCFHQGGLHLFFLSNVKLQPCFWSYFCELSWFVMSQTLQSCY